MKLHCLNIYILTAKLINNIHKIQSGIKLKISTRPDKIGFFDNVKMN